MLAARRLAVLLGLTAILALPSSGGAAAPSGGAAELRQQDTSLAAKERAATQELYSLEAQLAVARSRLAELTDQREAAEARLTRLRIELDVAWQSAYIAEEHLGARIRQLYQQGQLDPVAILLGAESLDEAIGGLDGLRSIASGDRDLLSKVRQARADLTSAKKRVVARVAALREAESAAASTASSLAAARAERSAYLAQLARQRGFNARRLERVRTTARAAGERTQELEASEATTLAATDVGAGARTGVHGRRADDDGLLHRLRAPRPDRQRPPDRLGDRRRRPVRDPARHPDDDPGLRRGRGRRHRRRGAGSDDRPLVPHPGAGAGLGTQDRDDHAPRLDSA